jgi:hypothetical protein
LRKCHWPGCPSTCPRSTSTACDRRRQPGHDKAAGPPDSERIRADTRKTPLQGNGGRSRKPLFCPGSPAFPACRKCPGRSLEIVARAMETRLFPRLQLRLDHRRSGAMLYRRIPLELPLTLRCRDVSEASIHSTFVLVARAGRHDCPSD